MTLCGAPEGSEVQGATDLLFVATMFVVALSVLLVTWRNRRL
jgi:hypothetical protein